MSTASAELTYYDGTTVPVQFILMSESGFKVLLALFEGELSVSEVEDLLNRGAMSDFDREVFLDYLEGLP